MRVLFPAGFLFPKCVDSNVSPRCRPAHGGVGGEAGQEPFTDGAGHRGGGERPKYAPVPQPMSSEACMLVLESQLGMESQTNWMAVSATSRGTMKPQRAAVNDYEQD